VPHNSAKWEKEISALEAAAATNPPPSGCVLFVGSSFIKRWMTLPGDFPGLPVVNHGFGGSQLADSVNFAERIIIPFRPRQVVIYAGSNDINARKDPALVQGDLEALITKLRTALPQTRISYISVAPTPKRWEQVGKVRQFNRAAAAYCRRHGVDFINIFPLMLGPDGEPKPDIFVEDRLHMNDKGYAIWRTAVAPYLK
jgi:lysophospholipase L1-like esterase